MDDNDRRWFCPKVTEEAWSYAQFTKFRQWVESGLSIIKNWAEIYGDYVTQGERAPMTERKRELIEEGRSEAQRNAVALATAIALTPEPAAVSSRDVLEWCRTQTRDKMFDSEYDLRKVMEGAGLRTTQRISAGGSNKFFLINRPLDALLVGDLSLADRNDIVRAHVIAGLIKDSL